VNCLSQLPKYERLSTHPKKTCGKSIPDFKRGILTIAGSYKKVSFFIN
jgi:hypothetical protein